MRLFRWCILICLFCPISKWLPAKKPLLIIPFLHLFILYLADLDWGCWITTANCANCADLFNSPHSPFRTIHFVLCCQCDYKRILPTQTKCILELSIIVVFNCHELSLKIAPCFCYLRFAFYLFIYKKVVFFCSIQKIFVILRRFCMVRTLY